MMYFTITIMLEYLNTQKEREKKLNRQREKASFI